MAKKTTSIADLQAAVTLAETALEATRAALDDAERRFNAQPGDTVSFVPKKGAEAVRGQISQVADVDGERQMFVLVQNANGFGYQPYYVYWYDLIEVWPLHPANEHLTTLDADTLDAEDD